MSEEMSGKSFSITWLFLPGLILIFIALISILSWSPPKESKKITNSRILKEYTPPPRPSKKPIYRPLPIDTPKIKSNLQPLPKEKPEKHQSKYQPLKEPRK